MTVEGPERFTVGCLCGSVRIVAPGRPYRVGVCHCLDCPANRQGLFVQQGPRDEYREAFVFKPLNPKGFRAATSSARRRAPGSRACASAR
ncbi:GFA family protein [Corallococcus terminator]|uniref:CENP-V/GFA domain-containing protein n=1 Tax=Corallococcus terminator TaxID=2316733 RepID=A0A3A8JKT7_9BACT|nr:hypothetical protein D7V88_04325 [Corallococcus terminator]